MRTPRDLADRMRGDGFRRETFTLPREAARAKAREMLERYPRPPTALRSTAGESLQMAGSSSR